MALIKVEVDGVVQKMSGSYYRGDKPQFYPEDRTLERDYVVDRFFMKGWTPEKPFITKETPIVAFGSCFAANISKYLHGRDYNILTKKENKAYVTSMGDGMVHTHAIRQQFEWAWENKVPEGDLWVGYDAEDFGYDEAARLDTKKLFDEAEVFVITLGLSEIWYDEVTGEVFWRQPPEAKRDPSRHKFRVATYQETCDNLLAIHRLIRTHRPQATIVFTVSPIPLRATFRQVSCLSANAVSKSILRAAVDQVHRDLTETDDNLFYFPSYDVVLYGFNHQWTVDRRHVYPHVLDFNMKMFEHYFCTPGISDEEMKKAYTRARMLDHKIGTEGHAAVASRSEEKHAARVLTPEQKRADRMDERRERRREETVKAAEEKREQRRQERREQAAASKGALPRILERLRHFGRSHLKTP